ncbi:AAA family ATPase [Nonomuraea fuscirosea]|uniref:AAA family ATPase n=1 Tax=Nonomuraea fuscirosea TaxID=1291556 RepID=UPI003434361F
MLTRIEIDGFKSFLDFTLDVPPFLALVGPNSSGKSNLLDALAFARAAIGAGLPRPRGGEDPLLDARRGKPQELFHQPAGRPPVSRFAVRVEAEVGVEGRSEDAGNLAAVLGRMGGTGELDDLMVDLSALVPDVTGVRPMLDEREQEWSFDILVDHEPMPGRLASDGTLRVLALLAALHSDHRERTKAARLPRCRMGGRHLQGAEEPWLSLSAEAIA